MDQKQKNIRMRKHYRRPLTVVNVDFATETCTHMRGRATLVCDCIGGELGRISESIQRMQRTGHARVFYGNMDLDFLMV